MMLFSSQTFRCAVGIFSLIGALMVLSTPAQQKQSRPAQIEGEKFYGLRALFDGTGFVRIPAGEFMMGSAKGNDDEKPVHRVRITRGFEMGKFEVTQAQWEAVMESKRDAHGPPEKANPPHAESSKNNPAQESNPSYFKGPTLPVENVSWDEVQGFLQALNVLDGKHHYRLPTEAEWEYAARAGNKTEYAGDLEATVWYQANSGGRTRPVGGKKPNAWGLFDMYGNVLEWVQDWYDYYPMGRVVTDPQGAQPGSYRVYRGCSWYSSAADCRAAFRSFDLPANYYYSLGFRLVRMPK